MADPGTLLTAHDLELTAEAVVAGNGDVGPVGALVAAAFLRLLRHTNRDCLVTFEESLADPAQPLLGEVEYEGETFIVANLHLE